MVEGAEIENTAWESISVQKENGQSVVARFANSAIAAWLPVTENGLTTIMITHNMRDAINHGNRLVMLDNGTVAVDIRKEDYPNLSVQDLLQMFEKASGDAILSDALLLS